MNSLQKKELKSEGIEIPYLTSYNKFERFIIFENYCSPNGFMIRRIIWKNQ